MKINSALDGIKGQLTGSKLSGEDKVLLRGKFANNLAPDWYLKLLEHYQLIGSNLALREEFDQTGIGVDLKWLNANQIIEEATILFPGKLVQELGFLPAGACLIGSGDPYFLKFDLHHEDACLVRIPHELSSENYYPEAGIEVVCDSLARFFEQVEVD